MQLLDPFQDQISDPFSSNEANISGFLNMLISARDSNVKNFIYASSSSAYGDHEALPKVEDVIANLKIHTLSLNM